MCVRTFFFSLVMTVMPTCMLDASQRATATFNFQFHFRFHNVAVNLVAVNCAIMADKQRLLIDFPINEQYGSNDHGASPGMSVAYQRLKNNPGIGAANNMRMDSAHSNSR